MTMHAPGVVCIAHGLRGGWISQDNGKLVVIVERRHFSRRYGQFWLVRAYDMQDWLHVFSTAEGNHLAKTVAAPQRNLIPLGPEDSFLTPEPQEIEMPNETEMDDDEVTLKLTEEMPSSEVAEFLPPKGTVQ